MKHWILTRDTMQTIVTNIDLGRMTLSAARNYYSAYGVNIVGRTKKAFIKNLADAVQGNEQGGGDMRVDHFTDERIDDIRSGRTPLSTGERAFLLEDTPRFEECNHTQAELAAMPDAELMSAAYGVWADYVRCMY